MFDKFCRNYSLSKRSLDLTSDFYFAISIASLAKPINLIWCDEGSSLRQIKRNIQSYVCLRLSLCVCVRMHDVLIYIYLSRHLSSLFCYFTPSNKLHTNDSFLKLFFKCLLMFGYYYFACVLGFYWRSRVDLIFCWFVSLVTKSKVGCVYKQNIP